MEGESPSLKKFSKKLLPVLPKTLPSRKKREVLAIRKRYKLKRKRNKHWQLQSVIRQSANGRFMGKTYIFRCIIKYVNAIYKKLNI